MQRLRAVGDEACTLAQALQQRGEHALVDRVVLGDQHVECRRGDCRFRRRGGDRFGRRGLDERQFEQEGAAAAGLAVQRDVAAHQPRQAA